MIEEFEEAVLVKDLPEKGLVAGDVGTVVDVHRADDGSVGGYTLEFFSLSGDTLAVAAVTADAVRPVDPGEVTHARAM